MKHFHVQQLYHAVIVIILYMIYNIYIYKHTGHAGKMSVFGFNDRRFLSAMLCP